MSHEELVKLVTRLVGFVWPNGNPEAQWSVHTANGVGDILASAGLWPMDKKQVLAEMSDTALHEIFLNESNLGRGYETSRPIMDNPEMSGNVNSIRELKDSNGKYIGKLVTHKHGGHSIMSYKKVPWIVKIEKGTLQKYLQGK